jgi:hypothetical protein
MQEILKKFGLTEDGTGFIDKQKRYWNSLESALWGGVLGFCCCGEPDKGLRIIRDVLKAMEEKQFKNEYLFHYYVLNKIGLAEHGCCIYSSWLTDAGDSFFKILNSMEL